MNLNRFTQEGKILAIAACLACLGFFSTAAYATDVKVDTSNIHGEASDQTKEALSKAETEYNKSQEVLKQYTDTAEQLAEQLYQTQDDLAKTEEVIEETKSEIQVSELKLKDAQGVLSERIAANYKTSGLSIINVLLGASDYNDFVSRIYYMGKIEESDAEIIQKVKDIKTLLDEQKTKLEARLEDQKKLEAQLKSDQAKAEAIVEEQAKYVEGLSADVKALYEKKAQEEAADKERKVQAALAAAEKAAREEAIKKAAAARTKQGAATSSGRVSGKPSPDVVANAMRYLGSPYSWGATGPNAFDCSGLTSRAYADAGISIPHSSRAQYNLVSSKGNLTRDVSQLVPGDLVFYYSPVSHVGIYIGNGKIVHSPTFGQTVRVDNVNVWGAFVGGGSVL